MKIKSSSIIALLVLLLAFKNSILYAIESPNIIVIIADDQRWDATAFMQSRMGDIGRTARFPWLAGTTPNLDRLSNEGIHFDNAFTVFSNLLAFKGNYVNRRLPSHTWDHRQRNRFPD